MLKNLFRRTVKFFGWLFLITLSLYLLLILFVRPSNDREWNIDQAVLPEARFDGNFVNVKNIRNFSYRSTSDYTPAYYDKMFDLSKIKRVWYIVEPFSGFVGAAHTFLSFEFEDGDKREFVAISIEIRKEKGETFSTWKGLLRNYELMYVVADERDAVKLRSNFRKDEVFMYPIKTTRERSRALFVDMLTRVNELRERPEFYNTLTNTCTTNIIGHVNALVSQRIPFRLEWLLPKNSDRVAHELGLIDDSLPLDKLREKYRINARAEEHANDLEFSLRIRE